MSQQNVETVRRQFAALARGGLDAVEQFWHPDIEWRAVEGAADDVGPIRGRGALRRYYQDWLDTMEGLEAEVDEVIAATGATVVVAVRNSGRGRVSGVPTQGRYYVTCVVREGRIANGREYETRNQALEAAGLTE